eukprot:1067708-Rhodomonas_salina.1
MLARTGDDAVFDLDVRKILDLQPGALAMLALAASDRAVPDADARGPRRTEAAPVVALKQAARDLAVALPVHEHAVPAVVHDAVVDEHRLCALLEPDARKPVLRDRVVRQHCRGITSHHCPARP